MLSQQRMFGLLILIISTLVRAAYDLTNELIPEGKLQIRLDYGGSTTNDDIKKGCSNCRLH